MSCLVRALGMAVLSLSIAACGESAKISTGSGAGGEGAGAASTSASAGGDGGGATTEPAGGSGGGSTSTSSSSGTAVACDGKTGPLGDWTLALTHDGLERNAAVHVPAAYDPKVPAALVLSFHGFTSNAAGQALLSQMTEASDERGFIVVYPNGTGNSWNGGKCCGTAASAGVDDVGFVSALIDELAAQYCIDPGRVFATGMSNGGFLSHRLGCELSGKIAAIAPVAGVLGIPFENCQPARKVPVMHFHGTSDLLVPYGGGGLTTYPSVADSVARWRQIDGCSDALTVTHDQGDSQCLSAQECADGAEVVLCTVDGGGHTWPGGTPVPGFGKTTMDLDATNAMLDFFEKHPMP